MAAGAPQGYTLESYNRAFTADPPEQSADISASALEGTLPLALAFARYLLNGPSRLKLGGHMVHPFDGHGFVRSFRFRAAG